MNVAFLNENTLGHTSYLPRFARAFSSRPELGITPHVIDVLPLPPHLRRLGDMSIRGLRKFGLDFHGTRWRIAVSRHAREQLDVLSGRVRIDAIVVNTQSVGLELACLPRNLPILVALDATFKQLADSPWFAPNRASRWFQPLTLRSLLRRERALYAQTDHWLPWSGLPARSLRADYGIPEERITVLPPSMEAPARRADWPRHSRPQMLFIGGHFERKGGPMLLEVFRRHFVDRCDLHLVTASNVRPEPGIFVHHDIQAGSEAWLTRWREADVFVFPSTLETFGIVLVEALAFQVPVVASTAGAAGELLADGRGIVVEPLEPEGLARNIDGVLTDPIGSRERGEAGRRHFEAHFDLSTNATQLAELLHRMEGTGTGCSDPIWST